MAERFGRVVPYRSGWRIDCRPHGYLYTDRGARFEGEAHTRGVLAAMRHAIVKGEPPSIVVDRMRPPDGSAHSFATWLARWLDVQREREAADDISPTYLRELRRYASPTGYLGAWWGPRSIHEVTFGAAQDWLAWLARERGVSAKTRRNATGALRAFLRWLARRGEIRERPELPETPVDEHAPRILTTEAQAAILERIPEARRGAFLALRLGARPGEVRALNVADFVQVPEPALRVVAAMKGPTSTAPRRGTKKRRARLLGLDAPTAAWILAWRAGAAPDEPLFPNPTGRRGRRWLDNALREEWDRAAAAAGLRARAGPALRGPLKFPTRRPIGKA